MKTLFLLSALFALCLAQRRVMEPSYDFPPEEGWVKSARVDEDTLARSFKQVLFLIKHRNVEKVKKIHKAVSDPRSPQYGEHLTLEQLNKIWAPLPETVDLVREYVSKFSSVQIVNQTPGGSFLKILVSLKDLEEMLDIEYFVYKNEERTHITAEGHYSLPEEIADVIDYVSGHMRFPYAQNSRERRNFRATELDDGNKGDDYYKYNDRDKITPAVIKARYNVTADSCTNAKSSNGVAEFQGQYYSPEDLSTFFSQYQPDYTQCDTVAEVVGVNDGSHAGLEASLDIQYIMGVAPCAQTTFFSLKSDNFFNDLVQWLEYMDNTTDVAYVWSVSYGEGMGTGSPSDEYQWRTDDEYMALGVRGLSIMISSGDSGPSCTDSYCEEFYGSYPATSVYVTSIGATRFLTGAQGPEQAVSDFQSGAGFSNLLEMPDYQMEAVTNYLQNTQLPPWTEANTTLRMTADASALGAEAFQVYQNGAVTSVGGTSASSPTFAAIITLLNDARFNQNLPPLGFLNYWIYQTAASGNGGFWDVTIGNDLSSYCTCDGQNAGFLCAEGWDPPTGNGTPNFEVLVENMKDDDQI